MPRPLFQQADQPLNVRVADLIAQLTLDEKISQMMNAAAAVPRLELPAYDWWNECLHGVGRAGLATVFPQAIGLAAMWNVDLLHQIAVATSDEARAKHHAALRNADHSRYVGLTYWSPNVNIFRDPRWGRGQETYGEDPYLAARLGVAFVTGLQGNDPRYLKLVATPKHFAVHSGPEALRHGFDAVVDERDLRETYLPAFEACVREGHAASIMGAYNRTNGEPCCASPTLLQKILREEWGFDGFVVSDCGAIDDLYFHHRTATSLAEAAAQAVQAGCDLNCGETYVSLRAAVDDGLIAEATLDQALGRLFTARFRLGMFDPVERVPFAQIPLEVVDCAEHRALALRAARESIVLLKNDGVLPLADSVRSIAVIGPNAADVPVLLGNYNGTPAQPVTLLDGLRQRWPQANIGYAKGCGITSQSTAGFEEAIELARKAEIIVAVMGLSQVMEGEEGQEEGVEVGTRSLGDRTTLDLPGVQDDLLTALAATGQPIVLVLLNGSALAVNWAQVNVSAIIEAWYPGQAGGTAVAEVLAGDVNPAGRLPVTFYQSVDQLPPFEEYTMAGRTYRYFAGEPLYPFGFGLSYTTFAYSALTISDTVVRVTIKNTGDRAGDEVAQCYVQAVNAPAAPRWQLSGFQRLHLLPGEAQTVTFTLTPDQLRRLDRAGAGRELVVAVGGCSPSTTTQLLTTRVNLNSAP